MDDVRKRSRWRTCRPHDGSVTAVSQVMGTAPQAIAGSAILRHMPRRMRRGHRRYSMRSGLIPPMRPRAAAASALIEATSTLSRRMASASVGCNAAIQRSLPGVSEASPSSATTAAELPSLSGASKSHANCSESSRFVIVTAFPSFPPCRADVHASTDYRTNVRPFC